MTGSVAGILSGVFGVGGGFLLVPALLVVTGISIDSAMATSLVAIALISASGFIAHLTDFSPHNLPVAGLFLLGSAVAMTGGAAIKSNLPASMLRRMFGSVIIATAIALIILNTFP
jgi:uncharacterized membrane protein YfcA